MPPKIPMTFGEQIEHTDVQGRYWGIQMYGGHPGEQGHTDIWGHMDAPYADNPPHACNECRKDSPI